LEEHEYYKKALNYSSTDDLCYYSSFSRLIDDTAVVDGIV